MQARALADLLGSWSAGPQPLNEQLAAGIERLIDAGSLPAGARVPSERDLATVLGVSRTTVVAAYDRLRAAGALRSRRGSGTRVAWRQTPAVRPAAATSRLAPPAADGQRASLAYEGEAAPGTIQLTIGAFRAPAIVAEEMERAAREDLPRLLGYFGYVPAGLPALRDAVAAHFTDMGLPTTADQLIITSGAQQALDLVARVLGAGAGSVIMENPTYPGAIDAFRDAGARLVPVPVDDEGLIVEIVGLHAERRPGQLVYVVPAFQNPTGAVLSDRRRRELVRVASENGLMVVEDLTPADLSLDGTLLPPLAALDGADQVITLGSLSKVAWGGIRIGWVRAPRPLVPRLLGAKHDLDLGTNLFSQAVAIRLLGRIEELRANARQTARERLEVFESALRTRLPSWSWQRPPGGVCLWVRLPAGDGTAFARVASEFGVVVRAGATLSVDGSFTDRIRLAYGEEPDRLVEAADRLAAAWAAFEPGVGSVRAEATVSV